MNGITEKAVLDVTAPKNVGDSAVRQSWRRALSPLFFSLAVLSLFFAKPLYELIRYSFSVDLYSHILLIPIISGYLIWIDRQKLPRPQLGSIRLSIVPALVGIGLLAFYALTLRSKSLPITDRFFWIILPYCFLVTSCVLFFSGRAFTRAIAFPLAFFFFITPFPEAVTDALEIASQKASADVYAWMMSATGATYFRNGQDFSLPRLTITIAQECSGIRSSFVLFLTSLLAGHMFLRTRWKKFLLAFIVIPLGLVRNGFRVYVLSMLSSHWNPDVIHGPLHHRGGPIFFVLSLIPFFLLLFWLYKTEAKARSTAVPNPA